MWIDIVTTAFSPVSSTGYTYSSFFSYIFLSRRLSLPLSPLSTGLPKSMTNSCIHIQERNLIIPSSTREHVPAVSREPGQFTSLLHQAGPQASLENLQRENLSSLLSTAAPKPHEPESPNNKRRRRKYNETKNKNKTEKKKPTRWVCCIGKLCTCIVCEERCKMRFLASQHP